MRSKISFPAFTLKLRAPVLVVAERRDDDEEKLLLQAGGSECRSVNIIPAL
jgi:hypothetical protein